MYKLLSCLSVCIIIMSTSLNATAWGNPCRSLAKACQAQGYMKGGNNNKGLVKDCLLPVVTDKKTIPGVTASEKEKAACKVYILKRMEEQKAKQH